MARSPHQVAFGTGLSPHSAGTREREGVGDADGKSRGANPNVNLRHVIPFLPTRTPTTARAADMSAAGTAGNLNVALVTCPPSSERFAGIFPAT